MKNKSVPAANSLAIVIGSTFMEMKASSKSGVDG